MATRTAPAIERITWTDATRRLGDLLPWPHNPRQIRGKQAERLLESVEEFGQVETLAIDPDNEILNGHQRLKVLMQKHGPQYEVAVRVSSRKLSERERQKLTVYLHKGAAGEFDFEILANTFDTDDLLAWGFEAHELGGIPDVEFKEYDESVADEVEYLECPACGHKWPK